MEMWLARDKSNSLYLYIDDKPKKDGELWMSTFGSGYVSINNDMFPEVKWSDEKPTKVKLEIVK